MAGLLGLLTPISALAEKPLPDPLAAGWQGESVCELLEEDDQHRMLRCTFPPGIGHERHFHAPHTGYTLAGGLMRITDDDGTREVNVPTGSSWISDGIEWHEIVNVGETTAAYLIIEIKPDEVLPTLSAG
jgi:quercetin dioxygenase-like cupin family protein